MTTSNLPIQDRLRASHVKRWHIVATLREQTIAEHMFNVAHIAIAIMEKIDPGKWNKELLMMSLFHDIDEVITGDIPSPMKSPDVSNVLAGPIVPSTVVKAADLMEAYLFMYENKVPHNRHSEQVFEDVRQRMNTALNNAPSELQFACASIITEVKHRDRSLT